MLKIYDVNKGIKRKIWRKKEKYEEKKGKLWRKIKAERFEKKKKKKNYWKRHECPSLRSSRTRV